MSKKRKPRRVEKMPGPEEYLRRLRSLKGAPDFAMFSDELVPHISEFLPTGSLAIDKLINWENGGWPIGGLSECASWEHVGKSTLLDQSLAHCQRMGGISVLIDSERGRDKKWTELLGVDRDKLIVRPALTLEDAFDAMDSVLLVQEGLMKHGKVPPMLIVWDSLGGTPSKAEAEGGPDDQHMAIAARVVKMNFRRVTQRLASLRCALVFANHFYSKIGGYGGGLETYGGSGVKYHTSMRVWLTRPEQLKIGERVVGHVIRANGKKNRISGSRDSMDTALIYGAGIDNTYTLFKWGMTASNSSGHPWIVKSGAWFWLYPSSGDPISFQQQFLGLSEILSDRKDIYQEMAAGYLRDGRAEKEDEA